MNLPPTSLMNMHNIFFEILISRIGSSLLFLFDMYLFCNFFLSNAVIVSSEYVRWINMIDYYRESVRMITL